MPLEYMNEESRRRESGLEADPNLPPCYRNLSEHDWLQIEQAAAGCVDGTSDDWPHLCHAIEKIRGRPLALRKSSHWLQGFCEGVLIQASRNR